MNYPTSFTAEMIETFQARAYVEVVAWHAAGPYVYAAVADAAGRVCLLVEDGATYRAPKAHDSMALAKMIGAKLDDDALRPRLLGVIGARSLDDLAVLPAPTAVEVGQLVWTQGMNRLRRGVVTKVGPKRVEVAYTTASSAGRIYRNSLQLAQLRVDSERHRIPAGRPVEVVEMHDDNTGELLGVVEVELPAGVVGDDDTAPHMCEPCARAGQHVEAVDLRDLDAATAEAVCEAHRDLDAMVTLALDPSLTTVRSLAAYDAAQTVLCRLVQLADDLRALAPLVDPDDRLRSAVTDLLDAGHSVSATLGTDCSIFMRAAAKVGL